MSEKNKNIEEQARQQQDPRQQFRDKRTPAPDLKKFNLPKGEIIIIEVGEGNGLKVIENRAIKIILFICVSLFLQKIFTKL